MDNTTNTNVVVENVNGAAAANGAATTPKKRKGFGVSANSTVTANLKFSESDADPRCGMFKAHIDRVEYAVSQQGPDAKTFPNCKLPRLTIYFASNHQDSAKRVASKTFFPVEHSVDTIPGGKDYGKTIENQLKYITHLLQAVYYKGRKATEVEEDATMVYFDGVDDNNNFLPVDAQEVADAWGVYYKAVADMFNGEFNLPEGKTAVPCYKQADGKIVPVWLKLIRGYKDSKGKWKENVNGGDLSLPNFIGSGVIEIARGNELPISIKLDINKERLTPVPAAPKAAVPSMPGLNGIPGGIPGGAPMTPPMAGMPGMANVPTGGSESIFDPEDPLGAM